MRLSLSRVLSLALGGRAVVGFFGCWAIVGVILVVLWAVLHIGG